MWRCAGILNKTTFWDAHLEVCFLHDFRNSKTSPWNLLCRTAALLTESPKHKRKTIPCRWIEVPNVSLARMKGTLGRKFMFRLWQCTLPVALISRSHFWWEHFSTYFSLTKSMPLPMAYLGHSTQDYQHLKGTHLDQFYCGVCQPCALRSYDWFFLYVVYLVFCGRLSCKMVDSTIFMFQVLISLIRHWSGLKFKRASSCSSCKASQTTTRQKWLLGGDDMKSVQK